ncbi:glutathione S-transferase T2-like [Brassica rapa]|uniref:glutathione S-transferase T2-like n=1 Tax=Brassica campestris TaxID=3711 RepID=UPI00142DA713|nr:glutathione S-transferase T2-like [Brassica rapa]
MDPRIPYSQSTGYMGLLNSQQGSVCPENSPYETFPSLSQQFPQFSSQESEAPTPPTEIPVERGRRHKWTPSEDEMLITLNGGDGGNVVESSEHVHYKQRWHKINIETNRFCASYAAAERQISSGQHENDVLKKAHEIFYLDHQSKFTLEHAWCVLRYEQKWLNLNTTHATVSSKRKTGVSDSQPTTPNVGGEEIRPEGVKAAKANRSAMGKGKSVADCTAVWELRKEDLERKEKLSKLAILDTLLARTGPLSEAEEVAKNKLLAEYF